MSRADATPVTALVDRDGCVLRADDRLMALQIEAGGQPHGPFALPALAALVRLGLRLGTPLSRPVELARDAADISLWAQLRPEDGALHISLFDWQERRPRLPMSRAAALEAVVAPVTGWDWQSTTRCASAISIWMPRASAMPCRRTARRSRPSSRSPTAPRAARAPCR